MLSKVKEMVRSSISGITGLAHDLGLTPNSISIIGLLLSILSSFIYTFSQSNCLLISIAACVFLLSGLCDVLDGALATLYGEETRFGGFLDSLLDRYSDAFVICGIIMGKLCDIGWGLSALIGSFLVSYARARAEAEGISMESIGLAERAERILIICTASFLSFIDRRTLTYGMISLALLTNLTVLQRMLHVYRVSSLKKGRGIKGRN